MEALLGAIGSFLSCSNKKMRGYKVAEQAHFNGHMTRQTEAEPMIYGKARFDKGLYETPSSSGSFAKILCECCCGCLCAMLVTTLAVCAFVVCTTSVEVERTKFTFWNYYIPQLKYFMAGQRDSYSWTQWYSDLAAAEDPLVGLGPGPNTRTYYGWEDVKDILQDFAVRIGEGTMRRHNELGMMILSGAMWPETGTAVTGLTNIDHSVVRPYLGAVLDGAAASSSSDCDGSTCWNAGWLRQVFRERFATIEALSRDDLMWIVSAVLHKVHLNLTLSDKELRNFAAFQRQLIRVVPFKRNFFWGTAFGGYPKNTKKEFEGMYKDAIMRKWPEEPWKDRPAKLTVLANAMLDSLALLGGAHIATALDFLLSILFMEGEPGKSIRPLSLTDEVQLHDFVWETLRRYPPATGVPRWITDDKGATWQHQIANVLQALHDERVFEKPLEFRPGRPGLNHKDNSRSIGWADFAEVNGDASHPHSHSCPGKQLSFQLLTAFLQEFDAAGPWQADDARINLNS
eukprot:CAMPEP_0172886598 /NCGR_PEP_ID=MMETSP1075-20121228/131454_1 /TAXON_ID=2916 /ORGANISM="Ceratium fusus, Strain PA161109" /LENGTH=513 /DNA_ID=CAMNT_0013740115 /DNA_START=24 /DNA_END=1562 /DNA_ORIENTATION=-